MLIILGIIVGAVLTYLLTSSKEIKAYRRDKLEKCAFSVHELAKSLDRSNRIIINLLTTKDTSRISEFYSLAETEKISNKIEDCDIMITLHAQFLNREVEDYVKNIGTWLIKLADLPTCEDTYPELADQMKDLYKQITESQNILISAISDKIYEDSYFSRLTNYVKQKWPLTSDRKKQLKDKAKNG